MRPSSLHASDTLTRALAKRATSSRVTVNRRPCSRFTSSLPLATAFTAVANLLSGRKSDKCAELSACQICSPLFVPLLSLHAARESPVRDSSLSPSRFVAFSLHEARGQSSLSVEYAVVQYFLFLIAAYISHAWESSRQGESLILLGRSLREERNTGLASLTERASVLPGMLDHTSR